MKDIEKILNEYKENNKVSIDIKKISQTINISQKSFYESKENRTISYFEFLFEQAKYIQKRWWAFQIIILIALWQIIRNSIEVEIMRRCIGILVPTFVIMILPELLKNKVSKSLEIECSTCYSLKEIYSAKMILFTIIDAILISIFMALVSATTKMKLIDLIIQFFIPFNITCLICLMCLCNKRRYNYYLKNIIAFVCIAIWIFIIVQENIYNIITLPIWIGILVLSSLYLAFSIFKILNENASEELWEGKVWN